MSDSKPDTAKPTVPRSSEGSGSGDFVSGVSMKRSAGFCNLEGFYTAFRGLLEGLATL